MKVLFVFKNENFLAPTGICSLSAFLRREGHESLLCEVNSCDYLKAVSRIRPDVVAYSSSTGESKHYLEINKKIKEYFPGIFTVMGGPHPTFYPQVVDEGGLDAVCVGEGELSFAELLRQLASGKTGENIPNIITCRGSRKTEVRELIGDLDTLPFPDYHLVYDNTGMGGYPLKSIITSRGCPYDCTYCFNRAWRGLYSGKGQAMRRHSVGYVIDEIKYVRSKWPLSCVKFYDDIFSLRADAWLEEFSAKYKKEIGLPFFILTRADLLSEDMVRLLKYAGCRTISMSIESGSPRIRKDLLGRDMSDADIIEAHRLCGRYGIHTFTNFMVGLPTSTIADEMKSVELAVKSGVDWAEFAVFHPYPGTLLGEHCIKSGSYIPDYSAMHTSYMCRSPLNCFSEREKNAQMNLASLGAVAVVSPRLRGFILRFLLRVRHNLLFTLWYYLTKSYVFRKKIYVTRTGPGRYAAILWKGLKQEWFRHENRRG